MLETKLEVCPTILNEVDLNQQHKQHVEESLNNCEYDDYEWEPPPTPELLPQYNEREVLATFCHIVDFFEDFSPEIQNKTRSRMDTWMNVVSENLMSLKRLDDENQLLSEFYYGILGEDKLNKWVNGEQEEEEEFKTWIMLIKYYYNLAKEEIYPHYVEVI